MAAVAAAHRQRERERIVRLALAANMPDAMRRADSLTILARLKLTFTETWADCITRIVKRPVDLAAGGRANVRENNRLNRRRTQLFVAAVEAQLLEQGRLVPDDVLGDVRR